MLQLGVSRGAACDDRRGTEAHVTLVQHERLLLCHMTGRLVKHDVEHGGRRAYRVKGSEIGDLGGGSLKHPRRWLGSQRPGPTLGVPSCSGPPGAL